MKSLIWHCCWVLLPLSVMVPFSQAQEPDLDKEQNVGVEDPFLWLEDVEGEKALDWVRQQNAETVQKYEPLSEFQDLQTDLLKILDSDDRIPAVSKRGGYYYNFWRDKDHVRGIWRRTTLDQYRRSEPEWETLLDLDQVAQEEGENWVWGGAELLRPDYNLCLISLSRGGADADVTREFDLRKRAFVDDGFFRPEAKGGMGWIDKDSVFIYTDFGEDTMTTSGYPRVVKRWERGTPLASAEVIYRGNPNDMSIAAYHDDSPGFERDFVSRAIRFYYNEIFLLEGTELTKIPVPNSARKRIVREYLLIEPREPWVVGPETYPAGSLLVTRLEPFMHGQREMEVLFEPSDNTSLAGYSSTRDHLLLNVMEDVKNRLYVLTPGDQGWKREPLQGAPELGQVSARAIDPDETNEYFMTVTDYITPTTLYYGRVGAEPELLKQLSDQFDNKGLEVSQNFATSKDGTKIPYFMVARKDIPTDGNNPVLLYGYGGFEISLTPRYSATVGRAWTSQGGVYVVANIRGGGEYGPRWHQAALKENRLRAYEDFAAVAEDLYLRGISRKEKLAIQGGSNGGLLVGNMVTLYPDLFQAAVCQVPLLDMKRYHKLLAGASWMAEYGDPDQPEQWKYIQTFSPYQNVRPDVEYPKVLFTTSTRDDRVHPGHARKMMAKMKEMGHDVQYYENIEGGHGGAANNQQAAYMQALAYMFLKQQLFDSPDEN